MNGSNQVDLGSGVWSVGDLIFDDGRLHRQRRVVCIASDANKIGGIRFAGRYRRRRFLRSVRLGFVQRSVLPIANLGRCVVSTITERLADGDFDADRELVIFTLDVDDLAIVEPNLNGFLVDSQTKLVPRVVLEVFEPAGIVLGCVVAVDTAEAG